ncbi:hypothetical protein ACSSS7_000152 [Eimeria intestinalis]
MAAAAAAGAAAAAAAAASAAAIAAAAESCSLATPLDEHANWLRFQADPLSAFTSAAAATTGTKAAAAAAAVAATQRHSQQQQQKAAPLPSSRTRIRFFSVGPSTSSAAAATAATTQRAQAPAAAAAAAAAGAAGAAGGGAAAAAGVEMSSSGGSGGDGGPGHAASLHGVGGGECLVCFEDITPQFHRYCESVSKSTCAREQQALLRRGPPINLSDAHAFPVCGAEEVEALWVAAQDKEVSSKLDGSLVLLLFACLRPGSRLIRQQLLLILGG